MPNIEPDSASEVLLPSARGGSKPTLPLTIEAIRELSQADLDLALESSRASTPAQALLTLRHAHHHLAQLLAQGHPHEAISLMTGYSPSYISSLQGDPLFRDLVGYYAGIKEQQFVEVAERMKVLGLASLDELQDRLASAPEDWTKRELMEMAELLLIKGRSSQVSIPGQASATNVAIEVKFVASPPGRQIDGEAIK